MKFFASLILGFVSAVLFVGAVSATSMQEPARKSLRVTYENGDSAEVDCKINVDSCEFQVTVNSKAFVFGANDLLGLNPIPEGFYLFSGFASARDLYFSFHVRVNCPEGYVRRTSGSCYVSGLVKEGTLSGRMVVDY